MMIPFLWMLSTSLKTRAEVFSRAPFSFPTGLHWENYTKMWFALPGVTFGTFFQNSIVIASLATVGQVVTCSMAAYAFAVFEFRGKRILFALILATLIIPFQIVLVPNFILYRYLPWPLSESGNFIGTNLPLWVWAFFGGAFGTFLLRQFFLTIPSELADAARVDGANPWQIFTRVYVPLARPALATLAIFQFMWSWNDLLDPLIYLRDLPSYTTTVGLAFFQGQFVGKWPEMMAGALVSLLPMVILFVVAQKYFVRGITLSGPQGVGPAGGPRRGASTPRRDYRPRQRLRVAAHDVPRPRFPRDRRAQPPRHAVRRRLGGTRRRRPSRPSLDASGVEAIVDLDGGWGDALRREIERWQAALPGRVAVFAGPRVRAVGERTPRFGETEAARLRGAAWPPARAGSRCGSCSACGPAIRAAAWSPVDDARLDPLWAAAGDARACPSRSTSPTRSRSSSRSTRATSGGRSCASIPDWHFWPTRPRGSPRPRRVPAVRRADRRPRGGRRPAPADDVHRRARGVRGGGPGARRPASSSAARTSTWTSRRGSPSSGASRTRPAPSSSAGPIACCSGRTWHRIRRWWAVYFRFLETRRRVLRLRRRRGRRAEPGSLADPRPVSRRRGAARVYRDNAARLIRF